MVSESGVGVCVAVTSASERRCSIQSCLSSNVMYRTSYPFGHSLAKCPGSPQRLQSIGIGFLRRAASISMGVGMLDARVMSGSERLEGQRRLEVELSEPEMVSEKSE